jgi:hypothetical protein
MVYNSNNDRWEVLMFAIIGDWSVDAKLESEQLAHIAANVRQQPGFIRGYWGQEVGDVASAHAVVLLEDEASADTMAEGVLAAIPSASLRIVEVLAEA